MVALATVTIGQLRQRVTIQKLTRTPDGKGGFTEAYGVRAVVNAAVEPLTFKELTKGAGQSSDLQSGVTIRYRSDIAITDRILWGSRALQIQSYQDPTGARRFLRLVCWEKQA